MAERLLLITECDIAHVDVFWDRTPNTACNKQEMPRFVIHIHIIWPIIRKQDFGLSDLKRRSYRQHGRIRLPERDNTVNGNQGNQLEKSGFSIFIETASVCSFDVHENRQAINSSGMKIFIIINSTYNMICCFKFNTSFLYEQQILTLFHVDVAVLKSQ